MRRFEPLKAFLALSLCAALFPFTAAAIGPGDYAQVSWKGSWYQTLVRKVSGVQLLIHYVGYDNSWDEWVGLDRVKIRVKWKGKWYPASVVSFGKNKVRIHYTGYSDSWDEWVGLDRIASYKKGATGPGASKRPPPPPPPAPYTPPPVRESAADVPSDPEEFLRAIERNRR